MHVAPGSQAARFSVEREPKVPKFKRCKISRMQLATLMTHFGAPPDD